MSTSPLKFIPTRRGSPCPVCGKENGNCRTSPQDADFIQCHTYADARKLEVVNGFRCVKEASGHTASFRRVTDNSLSDSQRLVERRAQRQKEQKEALLKGLSIEQRDKATKILSKHLGLSTKHRENLQNRGLTDKEIDAGYFFSVTPGENLPFGIPANYPGANNGRLTVGAKGFACPIWSIDGLIIGWQLRADDVVNNKYRWAKGNFSSHLPNGELPITIVRPSVVKHSWVADIEGVLKPYIAAQRLGAVCVGAAGGNVVGSPEQVKEAIAQLGVTEIRDFPDAGDVWNRNVMQRRVAKYEFYHSLGLEIKVGWWGQVTKQQDCDIDELQNLDAIEYISVEQFLETARWHGGLDAKPLEPKVAPQPQLETESDKYYSQRAKQLEEEQEQFEQHCIHYSEELASGAKIQWLANYPERVARTQEQLNSFEPWVTDKRDERFLNLCTEELKAKPGFHLIKSGMGTGKSTLAKSIVAAFGEGNVVSYRNSLLEQFCESTDGAIQFIWGITTGNRSIDHKIISASKWTAACVDSIAKLPTKRVLIIEEADKLVNHLILGATCRRDRRGKLKAFEQKIKDADYVFCFDADMSGAAAKYLQSLDPEKTTYGIHNVHSVDSWDCYIYTGEVNAQTGAQKPNNRKAFERDMLDAYSRGENILVVSDSQRALEALERVLKTIDSERQVLRVDSFTKAEDIQADLFLKDPNSWISGGKPGAVLLSPTAEASLDITYKHFDSVWGMFVGAINHWGCAQMLGRYRIPVDRHIFCRTHSLNDNHGSRSPIPAVVRKNIISTHFHTVREIALTDELVKDDDFELVKRLQSFLNPQSEEYQNPHFDALCNYIARDNYSRANLREELIKSLEAAGHEVMIQEPESKVFEKRISEATDDMLREMAYAIVMAPDITIEEARELLADMSTKREDWCKCQKAILKEQLPGYDFDAEFVYKRFLKDRKWISKQEMRWMVAHPGVQEEIDRRRWRSALMNHHITWDIRSLTLGVKVLQELGILDLAASISSWDMSTPMIHELKQKLLSMKERVKLGLGINVTPDSDPCALFRRLLDKIGIPVQGTQVRVKGSEKGERVRKYSINLSELANSHYQAAENALNMKHQKTLSKMSQVAVMVDISTIQPTCDKLSAEELAKYIHPANTPQEQEWAYNAEYLLIADNWGMVEALEEGWTPAFSSHVWEMLTPVGRSHVVRLAAVQMAIA